MRQPDDNQRQWQRSTWHQCKFFEWKTIKSPNNNHLNTETEKPPPSPPPTTTIHLNSKNRTRIEAYGWSQWPAQSQMSCVVYSMDFDSTIPLSYFRELIVYAEQIICWKKIRHKSNTLAAKLNAVVTLDRIISDLFFYRTINLRLRVQNRKEKNPNSHTHSLMHDIYFPHNNAAHSSRAQLIRLSKNVSDIWMRTAQT